MIVKLLHDGGWSFLQGYEFPMYVEASPYVETISEPGKPKQHKILIYGESFDGLLDDEDVAFAAELVGGWPFITGEFEFVNRATLAKLEKQQ